MENIIKQMENILFKVENYNKTINKIKNILGEDYQDLTKYFNPEPINLKYKRNILVYLEYIEKKIKRVLKKVLYYL